MYTTEHESAIADAVNAVRNRPNDFAAFVDLGSAYFEAGRLDDALTAYQQASTLNPGSAPVYCKIGSIQSQIGTPQQAIRAYEKAIASDPHYLPAYLSLGWLYVRKLFDYDQAILTYERGLAANPDDPSLTDYLGDTYARMGQTEKALEILEASAREYPDQVFVYSTLSYIYLRLKRLDEAAAAARREIELRDAHSPHRVLGFIGHLRGQNNEAVAELNRAIELDPKDYEARAALAKLYRIGGNLTAAEDQYDTGMKLSMEDQEGGLACFHAVYGDVEKALALLETACTKDQISPGWLKIDPEFVFIQDDPRFQALTRERN